MTQAMQTPDEINCVLSPQILALGQALAPVVKSARRELSRRVRPTGQAFLTFALDRYSVVGTKSEVFAHTMPYAIFKMHGSSPDF